jgi:hypothetical protein
MHKNAENINASNNKYNSKCVAFAVLRVYCDVVFLVNILPLKYLIICA